MRHKFMVISVSAARGLFRLLNPMGNSMENEDIGKDNGDDRDQEARDGKKELEVNGNESNMDKDKTGIKNDNAQPGNVDETTPLLTKSKARKVKEKENKEQEKWREYSELLKFVFDNLILKNNDHVADILFVITAFLSQICESACTLLAPLAIKCAIDILNGHYGHEKQWQAFIYTAFHVGLYFGSNMLHSLKYMTWERVRRKKGAALEAAAFRLIHQKSLSFLYQTSIGMIDGIVARGINSINSLFTLLIFDFVPLFSEIGITVALFMKFRSPGIVATILMSVALHLLVTFSLNKKLLNLWSKWNDADDARFYRRWDSLNNFETVKYFAAEQQESKVYAHLMDEEQKWALRRDNFEFIAGGLKDLTLHGGLFIALLMSASSVIKGDISPGAFVAINAYYYRLFTPLLSVGGLYDVFTTDMTCLEKFRTFLTAKPEIQELYNAEPINVNTPLLQNVPMIEFNNVSMSYKKGEESRYAVQNISFKLDAGRKLGFVGTSGSGKTTCARLLLRLFEVSQGQVLVNGVDVRKVTLKSLRQAIGIVAQETVLYNETLRLNIAYGKPNATEEDICAAAEAAALGEFVAGLEDGLNTVCGSRGVKLSGGERQRVGIARCIITDPKIVILDESTSSLDTVTERKVQKNLDVLCQGRTTLIIAHRLSTVMQCDQILVLKNGKVIERGTHDSLLALKGMYSQMWDEQAGISLRKRDGNT